MEGLAVDRQCTAEEGILEEEPAVDTHCTAGQGVLAEGLGADTRRNSGMVYQALR